MPKLPWRPFAALLLALLIGAAPAGAQMLRHGGDAEPPPPPVGSLVTRWSLAADRLGRGSANWRTMVVMHMAMHDALNAIEPRYARWAPPAADEPPAAGASPAVAMAAAAYQVLLARHAEEAAGQGDQYFRDALAAEGDKAAANAGIRLGSAIARATVARLPPSTNMPQPFPEGTAPGHWRPAPPFLQNGLVGDAPPFLFESAGALRGPPPPPLGSDRYIAEAAEVRRLGGELSRERTPAQTEAARFWAYQSSQRNFIGLAAGLLADHPPAGGKWDEARTMAQLSAGLADSFIIAWDEKRHFHWWRPIHAINLGSDGVPADPRWEPLFATPPHPDYPSGHASDCSVGARVLEGAFEGVEVGEVAYTAADLRSPTTRRYPNFAAISTECAESRIWAGAHFRAANEEGQRLGALIARRALESVPPVARRAAALEGSSVR